MPAKKKKIHVSKFHCGDKVKYEGRDGLVLDSHDRHEHDTDEPYTVYSVLFGKKEKLDVREDELKKA